MIRCAHLGSRCVINQGLRCLCARPSSSSSILSCRTLHLNNVATLRQVEMCRTNLLLPRLLKHTDAPENGQHDEVCKARTTSTDTSDIDLADAISAIGPLLMDKSETSSEKKSTSTGPPDMVLEDGSEDDPENFDTLISVLTLKVRSMDDAVLKSCMTYMKSSAKQLGLKLTNEVQLPKHIEKRTLLSSPFIFKKHHQQYEIRTYGRMLELSKLTKESADIYLEYIQRNIPEGVSMSIEQTELEPLPSYFREQNSG